MEARRSKLLNAKLGDAKVQAGSAKAAERKSMVIGAIAMAPGPYTPATTLPVILRSM